MAEFGISMFPTDYAIQPIELALAAEQRGFESMFFPEHTHIPTSRKTPFPGGTELPKEYWHTHDPFVALGAAAAVTKKLKLGTGVCLVIERDPITLAKEVASLDMISGGRVVFGIGAGASALRLRSTSGNGQPLDAHCRRVGAIAELEIVGRLKRTKYRDQIARNRDFAHRIAAAAILDPEARRAAAVVAGHRVHARADQLGDVEAIGDVGDQLIGAARSRLNMQVGRPGRRRLPRVYVHR